MIQLNVVCVVVVCMLSTASPTLNNPRAPELNLDPVYADFTSFGKGNTLVESALEAKMGGNEPAESSAKTLGLLSGSGSFESRSDTGLDLPKGSSAGTSGKLGLFLCTSITKLVYCKLCEGIVIRLNGNE
ncbi:uncharacterized protein [Cherax quadricarinatus]|uniref:uncharacterized protein n=1 Tax=Cherax quadricarinatus TaxID=27406 RepID=UPI00387EDB69